MPKHRVPSPEDWAAAQQMPRSNQVSERDRLELANRRLGSVLSGLWELAEHWDYLGRSSSLSREQIDEMASIIAKAQSESHEQFAQVAGGYLY